MNIYDIFGECYRNGTNGTLRSASEGKIPEKKNYWTAADYTPWRVKKESLGELPPCTFGQPIIEYLNSDAVMKALNIPS